VIGAADRFVIIVAPQNDIPLPKKNLPSVFVNLAFGLRLRISKKRGK
jgi:hypothetical protein